MALLRDGVSTAGSLSVPSADLPLGLVMIRQRALVGTLPGDHCVYKITKITVIPLSEDEPQDLELEVRGSEPGAGTRGRNPGSEPGVGTRGRAAYPLHRLSFSHTKLQPIRNEVVGGPVSPLNHPPPPP